jgi:hypothetical protein
MAVSFARRQQRRRLVAAASRAAGAAVALVAALLAAAAGEAQLALVLTVLSGGLALASRHALRLAARSRIGAESEAQVRRELERLEPVGWSIRHAVDWPGRGDLDHVLRSPSGMGFVIETKTLRYSRAHVLRTIDAARWLACSCRRYPRGVLPVVCVARARGVQGMRHGALVVSLDRLLDTLEAAARCRSPDAATSVPTFTGGGAAAGRSRRNAQRLSLAESIRRSSVR